MPILKKFSRFSKKNVESEMILWVNYLEKWAYIPLESSLNFQLVKFKIIYRNIKIIFFEFFGKG